MVRPRNLARSFQVLSRSCINAMKMAGPLAGLKGMTLYVHFVVSGPANASFSYEDGSTRI